MPEDVSSPVQTCATCGAEMDVARFEPLESVECPTCLAPVVVSKTIGPYELVEVMGRGGMGVVYRAIDHHLDRQVALKVLRNDFSDDNESISKLDEEATITGGINHPNVVKVYTTGTAGGRIFIAMELVDKGTLDDLIDVQGRVAESQALEIASQAAQGLRAAHALGLIHRDVKPGNILFAENHQAKIVDFGLAMLEEASHGSDEIWGTPYYVSPERLDQKPEDFRSDMYSLGATIFHAIAGRPPFEAEDATRVALKHLKSQAVSLQAFAPWVSGPTAFVINRMLSKEPSQRYDSYDELIEHLEYARAGILTAGGKPAAKKRVVLETDEDRKLWGQITFGVLGLVLLLALGTGAYFLFLAPREAPATGGAAISASVGATGKHGAEFDAARKLLLERKPAEAAAAFQQLAADPQMPQPFLQWCLVHEALGHLLADNLPAAQGAMEKLARQNFAAPTPAGRLQADFFEKAAGLIVNPKASGQYDFADYNRQSYGSLGLLLAGLKDWQLGDFDDANTALRNFQASTPAGEFAWVAEYQPLVEDYVSDLSTYRGALMIAKAAKTPIDRQKAVVTLQKAKGDLRRGAATLGPKIEAALETTKAAVARSLDAVEETSDREKGSLAEARVSAANLCRQWKFKQARNAVEAYATADRDLQRERRLLMRKLDWLIAFKATLVKDLAAGYNAPVKLVNGTPLPGPIVKATDAGVEITEASGATTRPWSEISPASALEMAESFLTPELTANVTAERKWGMAVFALLHEESTLARRLLLEAAKGSSPLADAAVVWMQAKRVDLARARDSVVTASDFVETADNSEAPSNVLDGKATTRWGSSKPGPKWIRIDLGKECHLNRWVVRHAGANKEPAEANTVDFTLQRSADDKHWSEVDAVKNNTLNVTDRRVARFNARYLRILITKPNRLPGDDPTAHLYSFELWGWEGAGELVSDFFAQPPITAVPEFLGLNLGADATESSGSTAIDDRTGFFTIRSAAAGVGGTKDDCRFLHRPTRGTAQLAMRLDSVEHGGSKAEAGLMMRDGVSPDGRCVYLGLSADGQLTWGVRKEAGGEMVMTVEKPIPFPCWLKLERKADKIKGSCSIDGNTWRPVGAETLDFGTSAESGLAVMSRSPNLFTTVKLEIINFLR